MKTLVKYAILQLSIPTMAVIWLIFAGALAEGSMPTLWGVSGCVLIAIALYKAWEKMCRMQNAYRVSKVRARRLAQLHAVPASAELQKDKPQLWVA